MTSDGQLVLDSFTSLNVFKAVTAKPAADSEILIQRGHLSGEENALKMGKKRGIRMIYLGITARLQLRVCPSKSNTFITCRSTRLPLKRTDFQQKKNCHVQHNRLAFGEVVSIFNTIYLSNDV